MQDNHVDIKLTDVVWKPSIYPRSKWSTSTIDRYADAMLAGDVFPPITIESKTKILLDGKHRLEAYKKAEIENIRSAEPICLSALKVEVVAIPNGVTAKHYAATLSSRHGDRMSNADLKALALEEFNPDLHKDVEGWIIPDARKWGGEFGVSERTVYEWVSHLINSAKADRQTKAWRLAQLGWTHEEIGERLGVSHDTISRDTQNCEIAKMRNSIGPNWNDKGLAEFANRMNIPLTDAMAAAIQELDDPSRFKKLNIKIQPYDVWNFSGCHDLMGDKHPGRIPGELICHVLYFFTKPGDLVVDPMAGSGTTLDACLLMGRKARGYDIDHRHARVDIESHNLGEGWPETTKKAALIFWDPPYFSKMDKSSIGDDGYIEGSISGESPSTYLSWLGDRFVELLKITKTGTKLAFLMSDWDPENAKEYREHPGIFLWDYTDLLRKAGWKIIRQIQCPLPTQQVHPDIVIKFRNSRRLARLGRYLLVAQK